MNIVMMTNTFTPHVGGVARSIEQFTAQYRAWGHRVLVVAPEFDNMPDNEVDVIRIPAFRHFNHTDFSVIKPIPHALQNAIDNFEPDIIHTHHPFLVGSIALRLAHSCGVPLVFTHHTKYEDYTHNLPVDTEQVKQFAMNLATNYANTCEQIFAPSESIKEIIASRGVETPITVVPTGVNTDLFSQADKTRVRRELGLSDSSFIVGHLGRISKEKNIEFMTDSVIQFLCSDSAPEDSGFMICGEGPVLEFVEEKFAHAGIKHKLHTLGIIAKEQVPDAFAAMDVFAFTSQSETQGMVITEAMATSTPVVALDAPGVRDVVVHGKNGLLLKTTKPAEFAAGLQTVSELDSAQLAAMKTAALETAQSLSMENTAHRAITCYEQCIDQLQLERPDDYPVFSQALSLFETEWQLITNTVKAAADSFA